MIGRVALVVVAAALVAAFVVALGTQNYLTALTHALTGVVLLLLRDVAELRRRVGSLELKMKERTNA